MKSIVLAVAVALSACAAVPSPDSSPSSESTAPGYGTIQQLRSGADIDVLGAAEMNKLLPGASVTMKLRGGNTNRYDAHLDGTLTTWSDNYQWYGTVSGRKPQRGSGHWRLDGAGRFCVQIDWEFGTRRSSYCRYFIRQGDQLFSTSAPDDPRTTAERISISR